MSEVKEDQEQVTERAPEVTQSAGAVSTEVKQTAMASAAPADTTGGFLSVIQSVVENPNMNPDVIHRLIDAQERVMGKNAEISFNQAMSRLQPQLPRIEKRGKIDFVSKKDNTRQTTPYAKYEDIDAAIRPLLAGEGFSLSFNTEFGDHGVTAYGTLAHREGHHRTASIRLPLDTSGSKNNIQAMGSTISYAKRYLVGMLLNIVTVDEDDDGVMGGLDPIDDTQRAEIEALIKRTDTETAKFCEAMGFDDIETMHKRDYKKAVNALKAKEAQLKKQPNNAPRSPGAAQGGDRQHVQEPVGPPPCATCGGKGTASWKEVDADTGEVSEGVGPCPDCKDRI